MGYPITKIQAPLYPVKAFLDIATGYGEDSMESWLTARGFYKEDGERMSDTRAFPPQGVKDPKELAKCTYGFELFTQQACGTSGRGYGGRI